MDNAILFNSRKHRYISIKIEMQIDQHLAWSSPLNVHVQLYMYAHIGPHTIRVLGGECSVYMKYQNEHKWIAMLFFIDNACREVIHNVKLIGREHKILNNIDSNVCRRLLVYSGVHGMHTCTVVHTIQHHCNERTPLFNVSFSSLIRPCFK